ncbi:MAG: DUF4440 domain-containing protein [Planctomycetes bacterium]|nr:DUF4440 domain-containing protein [Planctomycetota bacterium]
MTSGDQEILAHTQRLLDSIAVGDWSTYEQLCDPTLSAFEPEARGHLVEGMEFHRFYFGLGKPSGPRNTTICSPHIRVMGDVAVISYVRLVQKLDPAGAPITVMGEETRVWQKQNGAWRHVHFHRSANS